MHSLQHRSADRVVTYYQWLCDHDHGEQLWDRWTHEEADLIPAGSLAGLSALVGDHERRLERDRAYLSLIRIAQAGSEEAATVIVALLGPRLRRMAATQVHTLDGSISVGWRDKFEELQCATVTQIYRYRVGTWHSNVPAVLGLNALHQVTPDTPTIARLRDNGGGLTPSADDARRPQRAPIHLEAIPDALMGGTSDLGTILSAKGSYVADHTGTALGARSHEYQLAHSDSLPTRTTEPGSLLAWAHRKRIISADERALLTRVYLAPAAGYLPIGEAARERSLTQSAIRKRCQRALEAIRVALDARSPLRDVAKPAEAA